ncbi:hypothetical protein T265_09468 [Opisthorchis viverrini]|uniref:Uncharacterized protein n=1 Tax=Opisthorchis viverrini TaxID=6198 RepID=A0A074ZA44_OPIVI|nr:hypothetical protein T265_09468 [Opisthorchis viverrini]KER22457.1 hypothetical protein T265_09468 [Opisthorchis viverrini]
MLPGGARGLTYCQVAQAEIEEVEMAGVWVRTEDLPVVDDDGDGDDEDGDDDDDDGDDEEGDDDGGDDDYDDDDDDDGEWTISRLQTCERDPSSVMHFKTLGKNQHFPQVTILVFDDPDSMARANCQIAIRPDDVSHRNTRQPGPRRTRGPTPGK